MSKIWLSALVLSFTSPLFAAPAPAKDDKPAPSKSDPKGVPLEITITGKKTYPLDLGGKTPEEFRAALKKGGELGALPQPPAVDLKVTIKNTGKETIMVYNTGDPVVLTLNLEGKGAINSPSNLAFTTEFRLPQGVGLEPGKTIEFPVKRLSSGARGASQFSYWTAPGEYELVATWVTGVSPKPAGSEDQGDGYGRVTLTSAPFKIKVEAK